MERRYRTALGLIVLSLVVGAGLAWAATARERSLAIYPAQRIPLLFNHQQHLEAGAECVTCHDGARSSANVTDRNLPGHEECGTCHDIEAAQKGRQDGPARRLRHVPPGLRRHGAPGTREAGAAHRAPQVQPPGARGEEDGLLGVPRHPEGREARHAGSSCPRWPRASSATTAAWPPRSAAPATSPSPRGACSSPSPRASSGRCRATPSGWIMGRATSSPTAAARRWTGRRACPATPSPSVKRATTRCRSRCRCTPTTSSPCTPSRRARTPRAARAATAPSPSAPRATSARGWGRARTARCAPRNLKVHPDYNLWVETPGPEHHGVAASRDMQSCVVLPPRGVVPHVPLVALGAAHQPPPGGLRTACKRLAAANDRACLKCHTESSLAQKGCR